MMETQDTDNQDKSPFQMTKEKLNSLPLTSFPGKVHLVSMEEEVSSALEYLKGETLLGLDTETRPSFRKGKHFPLSLIQLSSETHACLIRVSHVGIPPELRDILSSEKIKKIAQEPCHELKKLKEEWDVEAKNVFNLGTIAKRLHCSPRSVKGLCGIFLGHRISKASQTSNWDRKILTQKQIDYAATDAWACIKIFLEVQKRGLLPK